MACTPPAGCPKPSHAAGKPRVLEGGGGQCTLALPLRRHDKRPACSGLCAPSGPTLRDCARCVQSNGGPGDAHGVPRCQSPGQPWWVSRPTHKSDIRSAAGCEPKQACAEVRLHVPLTLDLPAVARSRKPLQQGFAKVPPPCNPGDSSDYVPVLSINWIISFVADSVLPGLVVAEGSLNVLRSPRWARTCRGLHASVGRTRWPLPAVSA